MRKLIVAGMMCGAVAASLHGDIVLENARLRLTLGDDAVVKSLTVKPSGEECIDATERLSLFAG